MCKTVIILRNQTVEFYCLNMCDPVDYSETSQTEAHFKSNFADERAFRNDHRSDQDANKRESDLSDTSMLQCKSDDLHKGISKQSPFFAKYFPNIEYRNTILHWKKDMASSVPTSSQNYETCPAQPSSSLSTKNSISSCMPSTDISQKYGTGSHSQPEEMQSSNKEAACSANTSQRRPNLNQIEAIIGSDTALPAHHSMHTDTVSSTMVSSMAAEVLPCETQHNSSETMTSWGFCPSSTADPNAVHTSDKIKDEPFYVQSQEEMGMDRTPHSTSAHFKQHQEGASLCQVCEDVAAGFYCRAFVCEACKKFFIRASKQEKQKFVCLRQKSCKITKESRVQCQYCRYQKCLQLKMHYPGEGKRSVNSIQMSGIPCRVCGAPSSGFHFGALTCEGCKGFFRRMAKERDPGTYKCSAERMCEISTQKRNICKACRYQKCLSIGMSLEGSRIGRQPNALKHAISMEVKKQQLEQPEPCASHPQKPSDMERLEEDKIDGDGDRHSHITPVSDSAGTNSNLCPPLTSEIKTEITSDFHVDSSKIAQVPREILEKWEPDTEEYEDFELTQSLELAGKELTHMSAVDRAKSDLMDASMTHSYANVWKKQMKHFEFHALCTLRFTKKVPGFRDLLLDDQMALVQNAIYPIVVLNHARAYEPDTGFYNFFNFSKLEEHAVLEMCPEFTMLQSHFIHMGMMAHAMKMTDMEYTVLSCLLICNPECPGITAVDEIGQMQNRFMNFFENLEKRMYTNGQTRFGELMLRISELTLASVQHMQTISIFLSRHPDLEVPQLYREMFF